MLFSGAENPDSMFFRSKNSAFLKIYNFLFFELEAHLWMFFRTMSEEAKSGVFFENSTFEGIHPGHLGSRKENFLTFLFLRVTGTCQYVAVVLFQHHMHALKLV